MIDLETMGTTPDSAILSIGAVAFDLWDWEANTEETFYTRISIESNEEAKRRIDGSTVAWWLKQSKEAQMALFESPINNLRTALTNFRVWADNLKPRVLTVWAKDPDFDVVILSDAYRGIGDRWPFQYFLNRSVRTLQHMAWPDGDVPNIRGEATHHNALDDAIVQAKIVQLGWSQLMNKQ